MPSSLRSRSLIQKRRKRIALRYLPWIIFLFCIVVFPIAISRLPFLLIKSVSIEIPPGIETSKVEQITNDLLKGNYLFVFPKRNIFLYPKKEIETALYKELPRIESLKIKLNDFSIINISATLRKPISLVCENADEKKCFFVDEKGFIFDLAGDFSKGIYFIYRSQHDPVSIGTMYMDEERFMRLKTVVGKIRDIGFLPEEVRENSDKSFDLSVSGGHIIFSLEDNYSDVLTNLTSLVSDPTLSIIEAGELQVESVDLRYGKKIILKKKEVVE